MEEWRDIEGYEGLYQVSNEGRVKNMERIIMRSNGRQQTFREKILKPQNNGHDHMFVVLIVNGVKVRLQVHRLVAKAFIPNPNNYDVVHHIDHNPKNNRVENLMWMDGGIHHGMHNRERDSRTTYQYTLDGELVNVWNSTCEAAEMLGLSQGNIAACCAGGYWRKGKWNNRYISNGYRWSYEPL